MSYAAIKKALAAAAGIVMLLPARLTPGAGFAVRTRSARRNTMINLMRPAFGALAALALGSAAIAADWVPNKPIKLLVPYAPGAAADVTARIVSEKLAAQLGQPVVVENRGGAGGIIATNSGAKSPPDGYTLIFGSDAAFTINAHLQALPYDPIKDFEPVSLIVTLPMVLVGRMSHTEHRVDTTFFR